MGEAKNIYFTCLKYYFSTNLIRKMPPKEDAGKAAAPKKPKDGASGGKAKKEVVEGKSPRQVEQLGPFRQGHVRQVVQGSSIVQVDHAFGRLRAPQDPWIARQICPHRARRQRPDPQSVGSSRPDDLHS